MKRLVDKLVYLFLVLMLVCLSVTNTFAQTAEGETYEGKTEADRLYLEEYYKDKTSEEIWRDYTDVRLRINGESSSLVYVAYLFKEPFKFWAVKELLKLDLDYFSVAEFLGMNYSDEAKKTVLKNYINYQIPDQARASPRLERFTDLVHKLNQYGEAGISYRKYLIDLILSDSDIVYIPNDRLILLLHLGSSEQSKKVAEVILSNNPQRYELDKIIGAEIDFYSEIARQMLPQIDPSIPIDDFDYARLAFLSKKMRKQQ